MDYLVGLVMIKPDGVEQEIEANLRSALKEYDIDIIAERERWLAPAEIISNFFCNFDKYVKYLSSGKCKAFLVRYADNNDVLYEFKNEFRRKWLSDYQKSNIKNLIHTSDEGLEFFKQMTIFFGDMWSPMLCRGSDLLITNVESSYVRNILRTSNLKNLGILVQNARELAVAKKLARDFNVVYITKREVLWANKHIALYTYHYNFTGDRYEEIAEDCENIITVLGEIDSMDIYDRKICQEDDPLIFYEKIYQFYRPQLMSIIKYLDAEKIRGILIETSNMDLWEANSRYFFADEMGLLKISGSKNIDNIGSFFSSNEMYAEMLNMFKA